MHTNVTRIVVLAALGLVASCGGGTTVQFDSAERPSGLALRIAKEEGRPLNFKPTRLSGYLDKPEGPGPFPAMVLVHGCGGIRSNIPMWMEWFKQRGYVTIAPDSLTPRGYSSICHNLQSSVGLLQRIDDVYGAARYLASLPYVDPKRIGIMGFSNGAVTALEAVVDGRVQQLEADVPRFRVAIPLYPECSGRTSSWAVPVLVLIGSKDDWTLARSCTALRVPAGAPPFEVKVYDGAHHAFDELNAPFRYLPDVQNSNVPGGRGASVGPHAGATEQAKRDIAAFLDKYMAR